MLPDWKHLALFLPAALVLLLIPGPVVLYILARSIHQGRRAGLVSVLAAGTGNFCLVLATSFGLSAFLLASPALFNLVRYAGAAYLVYLGAHILLARGPNRAPGQVQMPAPGPLALIYSQGLLVSALNPKTALFFLAFLPQFVEPSRGNAPLQVLSLGLLFVGMGLCTDSAYALASSGAAAWFKERPAFQRGQKIFAGVVYIVLGISAAFLGR